MSNLVWAVGHFYETFDRRKVICLSVNLPSADHYHPRPILLMDLRNGDTFRMMRNGKKWAAGSMFYDRQDKDDIVKMLSDEPDEDAMANAIIVQRRVDAIKNALKKTNNEEPEIKETKRALFSWWR